MKLLLSIFILLVSGVVASAEHPQSPLAPPRLPGATKTDTGLTVGDKAPDFALPNGDGKLVMLSQYTARTPVVVVFYRGFW